MTSLKLLRTTTWPIAFFLCGLLAFAESTTSQAQSRDDSRTMAWLNEWHYGDFTELGVHPKDPNPPFEEWLAQGRAIPGERDTLIALLANQDSRVYLPTVALALGYADDVRSCPALLNSLNSSDVTLRREAINALGSLKCRDAVGPLGSLLLNDADGSVRATAADALGKIGGQQAESALETAITDQEDGVILSATLANSRAILEDFLRSDSDAFQAIELLLRYPTAIEKPPFWSDIANGNGYTDARRRWAVLQLVDRYLTPQSTLNGFGKLLGSPKWLSPDQIAYVEVPIGIVGPGPLAPAGPHFPTDLDPGDSLVRIRVCLPTTDDSTIYLRIGARPNPKEIYAALMGQPSNAGDIPIKEIAPVFKDAEDIGGIDWRGGSYNPSSALKELQPPSGSVPPR